MRDENDFRIPKKIKDHFTMQFACEHGNIDVAIQLLEANKINLNELNGPNTYLGIAAKSGHITLVKLLRDHGAYIDDIDTFGKTALEYAVASGHMDLAKFLIEQGANVGVLEEQLSLNCLASRALKHVGYEAPFDLVKCGSACQIEYTSYLSPFSIIASGLVIPIIIRNYTNNLVSRIMNTNSDLDKKTR